MEFLYYIAGASGRIDPDILGLRYALPGEFAEREVRDGPGLMPGKIVAASSANPFGYYPDRQTWRKCLRPEGASEVWIGINNELPPTPKDLLRDDAIDGHPVTLGDGNTWSIPIARKYITDDAGRILGGGPALRRRLARDESGAWTRGEVVAKYARLWEIACRRHDQLLATSDEDDGEPILITAAADDAVTILATNYRVGPDEIEMLGLLDDDLLLEILHATIDTPTLIEWTKKKSAQPPDGSPTEPGPPAESPSTGPPSPTSSSSTERKGLVASG